MKRSIVPIAILFLALSSVLSASAFHESQNRPPVGMERNEFSMRLFKILAGQEPGNMLFSPASVHIALSMTLNGAGSSTRDEMLGILSPPDATLETLNAETAAMVASFENLREGTALSVANSLWIDQHYPVSPRFVTDMERSFQAETASLDFNSPTAAKSINAWVSQATNRKIESIIDRLSADMRMVLVNAIHFLADWKYPFDANDTRNRVFHTSTKDIRTPFMNKSMSMHLIQVPEGQGVLLPYTDERMQFFAIMPDTGTIGDWLQGQDATLIDAVFAALEQPKTRVELSLPKFLDRFEKPLSRDLQTLGMRIPFDPDRADFSGMHAEGLKDLFIGEVLHKTFIRVDEKGTEAAAVTAVVMRVTSMMPTGEQMVFDRPFVYGIVDTETRSTLFLGIMEHPQAP
ncbi:MAG: serine proteinase inhibitor [Spirochaetae bacterium HGW-Spirochaetae-4]|nr:MAG: serine proteinase inhibitor [Spirochaetae bacterium HGW-Spirochaetae-4]